MDAVALYASICRRMARQVTASYSTSFSLATGLLHRRFRPHIYAIYSFLRVADEVVDTFHHADKTALLKRFRKDTAHAIAHRLSLNPILHAFQHTVHSAHIETPLIDAFFQSMDMDIHLRQHTAESYARYIHGSAEVVGLMCLRVFCDKDAARYQALAPYAVSMGAAFQKINFLRDLRSDYSQRGRVYFPGVDLTRFGKADKQRIEADIAQDFAHARQGIKHLPRGSVLGVYVAYMYFYRLFLAITHIPAALLLQRRPRLPNLLKLWLLIGCYIRLQAKRL